MICTICTDASYHPYFKVGSYAFWVVSDEFRIRKANVFKDPKLKSSDESEIKCVLNALWLTLRQSNNIDRIVINTDSKHAIYVFEHNRKMTQRFRLGKYKKYRQKYNDICRKYRKRSGVDIKNSIEFRHLKSHEHTDTPRNYVNQWCDDKAKEQLWGYIDKNLR